MKRFLQWNIDNFQSKELLFINDRDLAFMHEKKKDNNITVVILTNHVYHTSVNFTDNQLFLFSLNFNNL